MIDTHRRRLTRIRRVGPGLATRSNSSSSDGGHPVIPVKRKLSVSEDLLEVSPQKVTHSAPFSPVSDNVPLKRKRSERFLGVHLPNKLARLVVSTYSLMSD